MPATRHIQRVLEVGTTSTPFLPAAPDRLGLIISGPATDAFTLSLETTAVLGQGLNFYTGHLPVILDAARHGDLVRRAWSAVSAATQPISVIEILAA